MRRGSDHPQGILVQKSSTGAQGSFTWKRSSVSFSPICLSSSPLAWPMLPAAVRTVWRGWKDRK